MRPANALVAQTQTAASTDAPKKLAPTHQLHVDSIVWGWENARKNRKHYWLLEAINRGVLLAAHYKQPTGRDAGKQTSRRTGRRTGRLAG